jgi:hypothetical protein
MRSMPHPSKRLAGCPDGVMALHDNFDLEDNAGAQRRSDVPTDLRRRKEVFPIHQHIPVGAEPRRTPAMKQHNHSSDDHPIQYRGKVSRHIRGQARTQVRGQIAIQVPHV